MGDDLREAVRQSCAGTDLAAAQKAIRALIETQPNTATASFAYRHARQMAEVLDLPTRRLAVLASFTIDPVEQHLGLHRFLAGERLEIRFWPYQQWFLALAQPSDLDDFDPDAVLILHHLEDAAPILSHRHLAERENLEQERTTYISGIEGAIGGFRDRSAKPVILNTLIPARRGIERHFDRKANPSRNAEVENYNRDIAAVAARRSNVSIFDYASLVADHGRMNWFDPAKNHLNKTAVSSVALSALADELSSFLSALFGIRRKVVAVDLDNTLWGGIVGEDGIDGIAINGDYPGNAFEAFQSFLSNLRASGVLLAAVSKNNENDAKEVFEINSMMPLRWEDFSSHQINWQDKITNLNTAAAQLNVGVDSFVFADDSSFETDLVREFLPEVEVVNLGDSPSLFPELLMAVPGLNAVSLTSEDLARSQNYVAETDRQAFKGQATNIESFLTGLDLRLAIRRPTAAQIERVTQLFAKTNQFNLTTKRYGADDVAGLLGDDQSEVIVSELSDRFGNYGLIGAAVLRHRGTESEIDSFLVSCRALGRKVEEGMLAYLEQQARTRGASRLVGLYNPTPKNAQVAKLYPRFGFAAGEVDGTFLKDLDSSLELAFPSILKVTEPDNG